MLVTLETIWELSVCAYSPDKEAVTVFSCVAFSEVSMSSRFSPDEPPVSSETHYLQGQTYHPGQKILAEELVKYHSMYRLNCWTLLHVGNLPSRKILGFNQERWQMSFDFKEDVREMQIGELF